MENKELQEVKEELGAVVMQLENLDGLLENFDTTLSNHMNSYAEQQRSMAKDIKHVDSKLKWGFGLTLGLLGVTFASILSAAIMILREFVSRMVVRMIGG